MELVELNCPRSINLVNTKKEENLDSLRQTVDIYDSIIMHQEIKKSTGIVINKNDNFSQGFDEQIKEIIHIFEQYVGLNIKDLIISINQNPVRLLIDEKNILSGIFIALNSYYKNPLTNHELIFLSQRIDRMIAYYIQGGYKKILKDGKVKKMLDNPYNKYFLIDSLECSKEDLINIKNIIQNNSKVDYFDFNYDFPFIAVKDHIPTNLLIYLKKEFFKIRLYPCQNSFGPKVLIKYLK